MVYKKRERPMSEMVDDDPVAEDGAQDFAYNGGGRRGGRGGKIIITIVVIIIIIVAAWLLVDKYTDIPLPGTGVTTGAQGGWQAVFLSNGQVYFGKIKNLDEKKLVLADIYYLQVVTKPLQRTQEGESAAANQQQQELTLIKLGNELHGPVDEMIINRDHVLLTEKLKDDSRVVEAINNYLAGQKQK